VNRLEFDLNEIRRRLDAYDSEIDALMLERAERPLNSATYDPASKILSGPKSSMMHRYSEMVDQKVPCVNPECTFRDYIFNANFLDLSFITEDDDFATDGKFRVPEERPFSPFVPYELKAISENAPEMFWEREYIDITHEIKNWYVNSALKRLCSQGDDGQYGEAADLDRKLLRAVSRRVHYAMFNVAEAKFQANREQFTAWINTGNSEDLAAELTDERRERIVCDGIKAKVLGLQRQGDHARKIDPEMIVDFYKHIISLTTAGEVYYLMMRDIDL